MIRWKIRYRLSASRGDHNAGQPIVSGLWRRETGRKKRRGEWNRVESGVSEVEWGGVGWGGMEVEEEVEVEVEVEVEIKVEVKVKVETICRVIRVERSGVERSGVAS